MCLCNSFCGHGTGREFLAGDDIQRLMCRAATLLIGCSSGKLLVNGCLDAHGMALNYLLAEWWAMKNYYMAIVSTAPLKSLNNFNTLVSPKMTVLFQPVDSITTLCLKKTIHFWNGCQIESIWFWGKLFTCMNSWWSELSYDKKIKNNSCLNEHCSLL